MNVLEEALKTVVMNLASQRNGGEYHGPCPGCGGTDRFHVWPEQNEGQGSYWCRQCGKGGDLIQYFMDFCGCSFRESARLAGKELAEEEKYRVPKPPKPKTGPAFWVPVDSSLFAPAPMWAEKVAKFVGWANEQLLKNSEILTWLQTRGISQDSAIEFKLGWNPGKDGKDLFRPRESWGLSTIMKPNGQKKRLWIPKGLVIPYIQGADVLRVRIRRFTSGDETGPRYYFLPGGSTELMVLGPEKKAHVVVESELDAILVFQEARDIDVGAVALGSSHSKPDKAADQALKKSLAILNALDFDQAGASAATWWTMTYPRCARWPVPAGKDPGEAFEAGIDIREWVRAGLPPVMVAAKSKLATRKDKVRQLSRPVVAPEINRPAPPDTLPPTITELHNYLRCYPVKIEHSAQRTRLLYDDKWAKKNWGISKRISSLIFYDQECFNYINNHAETIITGKNFLMGRTFNAD